MVAKPISYDEYTEEELLKMSKAEAQAGLTTRQIRFCEYYVEGHNRTMALIKSGYPSKLTRTTYSNRMLNSPRVQKYIQWLKARALKEHMINAYDILDEWIRIAFSDITDFVNINPTNITLKPTTEVDGQLVKSIKSGRDGISIELYDKMKALDQLAKYTADMPNDWKEKLELRKIELMEQEFEFKKKLQEGSIIAPEDDGLIQAIQKSIPAIWDVEEES